MKDDFNRDTLRAACGNLSDLAVCFDEVCDSTNARAKAWLRAGNRGTALFAASEQTDGRGRLGRRFYSPAGSGLYLTLAYTPKQPLEKTVGLTSAAAVTVMRAIRTCSGKQCDIKWVNDLFWNGKKVCGILAEAVSIGKDTAVVVGIGVNLRTAAFPPELQNIAGSLEDDRTPRAVLAAAILRELLPYLQDPARKDWLKDYRQHSCVIGKDISFVRGNETVAAKAVGIEADGGLTIVTDHGTETLRTGEITLRLR